jgi:regulator of chromosome condensation
LKDGNGIYGFTYDTTKREIVKIQHDPMLIPGLKNITKLAAGQDFVLALDIKGGVWAWGIGQQDQLGRRLVDRHRYTALLPQPVGFPKRSIKIVKIFACSNHSFAIDDRGIAYTWGLNNFAQCGIPSGAGRDVNTVISPQPVPALEGMNMVYFSGGSHHSLGITDSGETYTWGRIDGSALGHAPSEYPLDKPDMVVTEHGKPRILLKPMVLPEIKGAVQSSSGPENNIVLTKDGKAYSWGFNPTFQCGQGTDDDVIQPTMIDNTAIRRKRLSWTGMGGQFTMLAAEAQEQLPNGITPGHGAEIFDISAAHG